MSISIPDKYHRLLPLNSHHTPTDQISEEDLSIQSEELSLASVRNGTNLIPNSFEFSTLDSFTNLTKSDHPSSRLSDLNSTETTKTTLIQCILDSFKPTLNLKSSSNNTSLSSLDKTTTIPCQSLSPSNKIIINFKNKNELGIKPHTDDLLEKIESNQKCSCHQIEIIFNNHILNQQLSYKQKQTILRVILRRQQLFHRYFSQ